MKLLLALSIVALAVWSGAATYTANASTFLYHKKHLTLEQKISYFQRSAEHEKKLAWWFGRVHRNLHKNLRVLASRYQFAVKVNDELKFHRAVFRWHRGLLRHYQAKLEARQRRSALPPHYREWLCIHGYEGSWTDDGSPYYGGLQMDISFQASYGGGLLKTKGTANNWTPLEQMWAAERAYRSGRGFYPWPNTARYCGLI